MPIQKSSVRCRFVVIFLNSLATALIFLILCGNGRAQSNSATDGFTPEGLKTGAPAGSFQLSGFDNINYFNGNLNFSLPLLHIGGRGSAGYTIPLRIERKWRVVKTPSPIGPGGGYVNTPEQNDWESIDPGYGPGVLIGRAGGMMPQVCNVEQGQYDALMRLTFSAGDGTEYELRDVSSLNGVPNPTLYSYCSVVLSRNRGKMFVSSDGSGVTFVSDVDIWDSDAYNISQTMPSGYLLLPDGSRYRIDNGRVSWIRDRNGNKITFGYGWGGVTSITDSLNRQITISYLNNGSQYYDVITYKGFGGATRTVTVWYKLVSQNLRAGYTPQTFNQLFPELNGSTATLFDEWVPSSVVLPDNRSYQFKYNTYGELARVELPTDGAIEYDYLAGIVGGAASGSYGGGGQFIDKQVYRRVTERRVYPDKNSAVVSYKSIISRPESSGGGNLGYVDVENRNNSGTVLLSKERHYYYGSARIPIAQAPTDYSQWKTGKEWKTENLASDGLTPLQRVENTWQQPLNCCWPLTQPETNDTARPNNPKVTRTLTTLADTNQISKQTFAFDAHFNQTDVYEYDYAPGAPPTYPTRHTHTDYVTINSMNGINYAGPANGTTYTAGDYHLRNLPSKQIVYSVNTANGVETRAAQTDYEYDKYDASANHANLLGRSGISGMDAAYTATNSSPARGNMTMVTRYANAVALTGAITTFQQYDVAGNVLATIDAGRSDGSRATTTFDYTDRYGSPDGDARANTAPSELSSAGQTSYAFPTKVVNALGHEVYTQFDFYMGKPVDGEDPNAVKSSIYYNDLLDRPTQLRNHATSSTTYFRQTTYAYDDANKTITVTGDRDAAGDNLLSSKSFYDGLGRTWRAATLEGSTWSVVDTQFDALGRSSQVSNPYRTANPATGTPPAGTWTTMAYDALSRVTSQQTPDTAAVTTQYSGNQVMMTDPDQKKSLSQTNGLGWLTDVWEIKPLESGVTEPVTFNGSALNGYRTKYQYDALNNLTTVTQQAGTSGTLQTRTFAYNSLSRLTSAANPESGTISYAYDPNGNLYTKTDARSITATYAYDALNRVTGTSYSSYPNGSAGAIFVYDNATAGVYSKGRLYYNYNLTYGANGELKYSYNFINSYDALGRPLGKTQKFLTRDCIPSCSYYTKDFTTSQTYDRAGNVKTITYPSGRVVSYGYNQANQVTSFTGKLGNISNGVNDIGYATGMTYNPRGQMLRETFGTNAALYHRQYYNRRGQLFDSRLGTDSSTAWDVEDPNVWQYANGTWNRGALRLFYSASLNDYTAANPAQADNNGNIRRMDHFVPNGVDAGQNITSWVMSVDAYSYDELNRLTQVTETATGGTGLGFTQKNTFDRWGNRKIDVAATSTVGNGVTRIDYQVNTAKNQLRAPTDTGAGTDKMRYDAAGNLVWDEYSNPTSAARDFGYDAENRIGIVKNSIGSELARYIYDPDGRRVRRIIGVIETWQVYGLGGELLAEYAYNTNPPSPQKEYGYRAGQMLVVFDSTETGDNQLKWVVSDHLGSSRILVNKSGAPSGVTRRDYMPFGEEIGVLAWISTL